MSDVNALHEAIGFATYSVGSGTAIPIVVTFNGRVGTKLTFTVLGADIRYRWDGPDPTPTTGHFLGDGLQRELFGHTNLDQLRIIAVSGTAILTTTVEAPE
jgi:hypothetical protein